MTATQTKPYFLSFDSQFDLAEHAEQLMARIVRGEIDVDCPDFQFVTQRLGWSKWKVNMELGRVRAAFDLKPQELSDTAYAAAIEFAEATKKEKGKKAEAIASKIAALQSELASLEGEIHSAESAVSEIESRREKLRNLNPSHIKTFVDKLLSDFHSQGGAKLRHDLKDRRRNIEKILELNPNSREAYLHAETVIPEAVNKQRATISAPAWDAYIERLRKELVESEQKIEKLDIELAEEEAVILSQLDYYVIQASQTKGS